MMYMDSNTSDAEKEAEESSYEKERRMQKVSGEREEEEQCST
jgi:hypothetical protein